MSYSAIAAIILAGVFACIAILNIATDLRDAKGRCGGITISSVGKSVETDFTGKSGGVAWIPGEGLLVFDPNEYELKAVKRTDSKKAAP